jgi:cellulose synthase/poly-beta-1,6-N-acetylglucosamine synthase-like glycosyltransferase
MNILVYFWLFFQLYVGYNLVLPLLFFIVQIFTTRKDSSVVQLESQEIDYGIIVTAYQQTSMVNSVVNSILELSYPNYIVYVVLDNCDKIPEFTSEKVVLLYPPDILASNTKSHFFAIENFERPHNFLTIIDSDNLVDPGFLSALNLEFSKGFQAVQGVRKAKNMNTMYACLDAARDLYYHYYDGKVLFELGSSATLAGSGMAFSTALYKNALENEVIEGAGFDKVLQFKIVQDNHRIAFSEKAIVYDEKTSRSDQLVKQRSRWINTWFKYMKFGFKLLSSGVKSFSGNQILFGLVLLRPPIFIFLALSFTFMITNLFVDRTISLIWLASLFAFVVGFFIALNRSNADSRIYKSLVGIPVFIFYQIISLMKSKKANKVSVATTHYHDVAKKN